MSSQSNSFELALAALSQESYQEAIALLETINEFTPEEFDRLFIRGDRSLHQAQYTAAVTIFEQLKRGVNVDHERYFDVQRGLIKAYQKNKQVDKAISLCEQLAVSDIEAIRIWGQKFLATLVPNLAQEIVNVNVLDNNQNNSTSPQKNQVIDSGIKLKSLAEFKDYCQQHLLGELKKLENKRIRTIATIIISQVIILFASWAISWIFNPILGIIFYAAICLPAWLLFCRSCIYVYGLDFKRNVIEEIIKFIDPENRLSYANSLFIEDKRQTTISFTHSQLFGDAIDEPDCLEQEDCVYGTIGQTDIFFAEIVVQKVRPNQENNSTLEDVINQKNIFRGLFFEAKFAKKFNNRTFVLPNDLQTRVPLINNWRGQLIKLEDPEFKRLFRVYGDNQVEARYILSTNLISRLVDFSKKAKRKVYVSFIEGYIYIAIRYRHNLFEPKLFKTMLSFAPLKEYFQNLQLMIGVVEELKLNRQIWRE